ncbi:MAG: penicillin-binding protein 1A [Rhodospirillales bacterium]|nr:penicillin-binding protein 1A [Rhodospirillales bacterium]
MTRSRRKELRAAPDERPAAGSRRPARPRPTPRKARGWKGRLARWALVAVLWCAIALSGVLAYFAATLPDISDLAVAERRPSVTLVAADGSVLATFGEFFGEPLRLKEMPPYLPQAVIAVEDRRFYSHFGIDPLGLLRAAWVNLRAGHIVQGGSTLTQQLAKNAFLTPERTLARKIQETLLALWLERRFSKDQILEIYLNRVYLGAGTFGVDAAARRYFNKSARQVNVYEAAMIAGLLKAPSRFSPARDPERAAQRAAIVLDSMVSAGFLTERQAAAIRRDSARVAEVQQPRPGNRYFADWVMEFLAGFGGGKRDLLVRTTLDPKLQAAAERILEEALDKEGKKVGASQAALVAMSPDGAIRAMVGGRDYSESQFNRATQALRQPGSAFKPFVYAAALEAGMTPSTRVVDTPIRIGDWAPKNYTGRYLGETTLAEAVAQSVNTVAVQVAERTGRKRVIELARRLGITAELTGDASLALGTSEVTLLELASAYAAFASGGIGAWPYGIVEVRDSRGEVLFRREGGGPGRVLSPEVAADMNTLLAGVIGHGTGRAAAIGRPAAGKTGTTQEYRDALFVGYTPDLVAAVWFGNDDNTPMRKVTGGTLPAQTWRRFMLAALGDAPPQPLPTAPERSWIDRVISGLTERKPAPAAAERPSAPVRVDPWQSGPIRRDGEM